MVNTQRSCVLGNTYRAWVYVTEGGRWTVGLYLGTRRLALVRAADEAEAGGIAENWGDSVEGEFAAWTADRQGLEASDTYLGESVKVLCGI